MGGASADEKSNGAALENRPKTIMLFDVDGTLTVPRNVRENTSGLKNIC